MRSRLLVCSLLLVATVAGAHTDSPEAVVAEVAKAKGVQHAARDETNPRILVIRVGEEWFTLPEEARRDLASRWRDEWRESVEQGVVSVLDARTEAPVVRYGAGGKVFVAPRGALMNLQPGR